MPYFFLRLFGITPVSWIADFQHCHHPEFFEEKEIMARNKNFSKMARACNPLVVSSEDALNDFRVYFSQNRDNVHVVHFTSYIDDEVKKLSTIHEEDVLKKYGLVSQGYAAVCNQFWKHKNHKVVLQAFKILKSQYPEIKLQLAMTGEPSDRRNPEYIQEIRELLEDPLLKDSVILLGFLNRTEQLCIMKHSKMIIQPSLFEGWGTVVEDAKVLNKKMILSDIKVHEEQKNEDCILFEKNNPQDLAEAIAKMYQDSSEITSRRDMTCDYANELEKIFV
jgi:glycosyltransferase involved in cell wall biosynthesis